jgi:hypothetical protein
MNAKLVIKNSPLFMDDIWQYQDEGKDKEWWEKAKDGFVETLQSIYDECGEHIPDDKLYVLGDVINMLDNIEVEMEE